MKDKKMEDAGKAHFFGVKGLQNQYLNHFSIQKKENEPTNRFWVIGDGLFFSGKGNDRSRCSSPHRYLSFLTKNVKPYLPKREQEGEYKVKSITMRTLI
ncbi:MAG: hypothetical protein IPN74_02395 [Haliscomenobacter sp.]|nr:hypothetical protein [Haliscomenobacter sp.]